MAPGSDRCGAGVRRLVLKCTPACTKSFAGGPQTSLVAFARDDVQLQFAIEGSDQCRARRQTLQSMADSDDQLRLFTNRRTGDTVATLRVVWVFRRQERELRVAQSENDCRLIVSPPDAPSIQRRFTTVESLVAFQTELLNQLRREGWALTHVEPERRSGRDRRLRDRSEPERRGTC